MKNQRPYLFDAIYRWIIDNVWTPHLLVDANVQGVAVPLHLVKDGQIVLNISPDAIADFVSGDFGISFSARFSGKSEQIVVPYEAMSALFSKEVGQGMVFPQEEFAVSPQEPEQCESPERAGMKPGKPTLKRIK